MSPSHFDRLGLAPQVDLDRDALERAYLERAQRLHPDRFVGAAAAEKRAAMEASTALNQAHATLRDPVRRAEYLCLLGGIDLDSSDPEHGAPAMDRAFLVDMIERREEVAEAGAKGAAATGELRERTAAELDGAFDRATAALRIGDTRTAAVALVVRRYLQRLVDEIDELGG